ncbi:hypothetical protein [Flavihumibacter solisilvae]|uniref:Uncharacterized protein n=1 Tax=Flavihumibacter solisilvae TaxID=1349421 RepID=A0A0C1KU57_9BACT|nr:hypothetical protein [Flavihumibacter solisilvae]KIC91322.1 hypothetical protein OI18_22400 [Flavihumibacter solisilvae]
MISIKRMIKHTLAHTKLTPEEADLYHRRFLDIMTTKEENEFTEWMAEDPAREFLFGLICLSRDRDEHFLTTRKIKKRVNAAALWNRFKTNVYKHFVHKPSSESAGESPFHWPVEKRRQINDATLRLQIKDTLAYTQISPIVAATIKEFFLNPEMPDEKADGIDDWLRESNVNSQLFDLFCDLSRRKPGVFERAFRMVERVAERGSCNNENFIKSLID